MTNRDLHQEELLPFLLGPYLDFLKNTTGKSGMPILAGTAKYNCRKSSCQAIDVDILCFTFDGEQYPSCFSLKGSLCCKIGIQNYTVTSCSCQKLEQAMVGHGLFLASPDLPQVAFHVSLLDLFKTLLDEMNVPVPLAVIVEKYYAHKGFGVLDHNVFITLFYSPPY